MPTSRRVTRSTTPPCASCWTPPGSIAEEFVGLDYFSLTPFFVLAGATVTPDAHTHGDDVHVTGVVVSIPEELEKGFLATLPEFLADAYGAED